MGGGRAGAQLPIVQRAGCVRRHIRAVLLALLGQLELILQVHQHVAMDTSHSNEA